MHRTLKQDTANPPRANPMAQQRAFDVFRKRYNEERPHQALQGRRPADVYIASQRRLADKRPRMEYPFGEGIVVLDEHSTASELEKSVSHEVR
jgi:hypothetical protein